MQRQSFLADLHRFKRFGVPIVRRKQPGIPGLPGTQKVPSSKWVSEARFSGYSISQCSERFSMLPLRARTRWFPSSQRLQQTSALDRFFFSRATKTEVFVWLSYIHPVLVRVGRSLFARGAQGPRGCSHVPGPLDLIFLFVFDLEFFCTACRSCPPADSGGGLSMALTVHCAHHLHMPNFHALPAPMTRPCERMARCHLLSPRRWNGATTALNRYPITLGPQARGPIKATKPRRLLVVRFFSFEQSFSASYIRCHRGDGP